MGPLGVGWRPPRADTRPLLVGGGIGTAPLLCLQDELGPEPAVLLGFRSAAHAEAASLFAGAPALATDDGSAGRQALVTDLLRAELDSDPAATVFACGPPAMLEAVRRDLRRAPPCPPSWRWSRGWPAASAPASAAWCPPATATCACAWTGRCSDAELAVRADDSTSAACSWTARCSTAPAPSTPSPPGGPSATRCSSASPSTPSSRRRSRWSRARATRRRACGRRPAGLINSIGLPNKGLEGFLASDLPELAELPVPLVVSVMGFSRQELATLVARVAERDEVALIELNVSCPNVETGLVMGADPAETARAVEAVRPLSPQAADREAHPERERPRRGGARRRGGGADAVSLINTLKGMALDPRSARPWLGGGTRRGLRAGGAGGRAGAGACGGAARSISR